MKYIFISLMFIISMGTACQPTSTEVVDAAIVTIEVTNEGVKVLDVFTLFSYRDESNWKIEQKELSSDVSYRITTVSYEERVLEQLSKLNFGEHQTGRICVKFNMRAYFSQYDSNIQESCFEPSNASEDVVTLFKILDKFRQTGLLYRDNGKQDASIKMHKLPSEYVQ